MDYTRTPVPECGEPLRITLAEHDQILADLLNDEDDFDPEIFNAEDFPHVCDDTSDFPPENFRVQNDNDEFFDNEEQDEHQESENQIFDTEWFIKLNDAEKSFYTFVLSAFLRQSK